MAAQLGRGHGPVRIESTESPGILDWIADQVAQRPQAPAASLDGQSLSYAALWSRAGTIATALREAGAADGACVPIYAPRSFELLTGILGILRAGSAYLPLDPEYPGARIELMLGEVRPRVLLTTRELEPHLPASAAHCLILDSVTAAASEPPTVAPSDTDPLVYVIYTSGSTGRPKGVAMGHHALRNLLAWQQRTLPLQPGERTLQFAALSFDVSFQEIFSTWIAGGTVVLIPETVRRDPVALWDTIVRERIHRLFLPAVALRLLADEPPSTTLGPAVLREVITAGEQLVITPSIRALFRSLPGARLHNHYGPTETHVITACTLEGDPDQWPDLPAIGQPIDNTAVRLLDPDEHPVPEGVAGELYLGGACLARGYLGNDALTTERFRWISFPDSPRSRWYRTGDRGRRLADGSIQFLGRSDDQVKIRGHRVELGEVERALRAHAGVVACAVVAQTHQGTQRLVAFFVRKAAEPATAQAAANDLREHLRALLPEFMVPSRFVPLERFPLTPSGKVDRAALAATTDVPLPVLPVSLASELPSDDPMVRIAAVWTEVLGTSEFGKDDSFFNLGGTSLLVVQVHRRLKERFDWEIPIPRLFEHPTLASLARYVALPKTTAPTPDRQQQILARAALQRSAQTRRGSRPSLASRP